MNTIRLLLPLVVLAMAAVGCGMKHEVIVSDQFAQTTDQERKVAVMTFDARPFDRQKTGSFIWGITKVPNAAEAFPALAASVIDDNLGMQTIPRSEVVEELKIAKADEQALLAEKDYKRIAELLQVDAIVIGQIARWRHSYVLVIPKGSIEYDMICLAVPEGKRLWRIRSDCSMGGSDDRTTALHALRDAMEALKAKAKQQ